jgi:hypothetical protein
MRVEQAKAREQSRLRQESRQNKREKTKDKREKTKIKTTKTKRDDKTQGRARQEIRRDAR